MVYMEAHMGLKEVGMPTKVALVALAFSFAPAFVGEDAEQQPVCGLRLREAEKIAAADRQRQKAEARACARSAQSGFHGRRPGTPSHIATYSARRTQSL